MKEDENSYSNNTAESEANLIRNWRNEMKKANAKVDSLLIDNSVIYYIRDTTKVGTGLNVKTGDKLTVKYTGMYLNGSIFDSSPSYSYIHKDTNANNRMIAGWEAGIELMKKGESVKFMIPSSQAYGALGSFGGIIPPYTPLIFVIDVLDIK